VRPRDLAVIAAVLLVGAFAIADAVRGNHHEPARIGPSDTKATTTPNPVQGVPEPPQGLPASGTVVFTDGETCSLREFDVASGTELPHRGRIRTNCFFTAPILSGRVAIGLGGVSAIRPFQLMNLLAPKRDLGRHRALLGTIEWASDGQTVSWCTTATRGFLTSFEAPPTRVPGCPAAFTADDEPVFVRKHSLVIAGRAVAHGTTPIEWVSAPPNAPWIVIIRGNVAERWSGDRRLGRTVLPGWIRRARPTLSTNGCEIGARRGLAVFVLPLDCSREPPRSYPGREIAWSPDNHWVAVAARHSIDFYHEDDLGPLARWRLVASHLAWVAE